MRRKQWIAWVTVVAIALTGSAQLGTVPRAAPDRYMAHAERNGVAIGATLLNSSQVKKTFYADVNRCCLVVEVGLYPEKNGTVDVALDDFTLRVADQDVAAKPSSPKVAALHSSEQRDRVRPRIIQAIEQELGENGLGEGHTAAPVAGYLYFSMPKVKKPKYQLEYVSQGEKMVLALD